MGRALLGQGRTFGDLQIEWLESGDMLSGVGGRGLGELAGYEIDDYEG